MLDIKFVREHPDVVKENIKKKFQDQKLPLVDEVIALDEKIRAITYLPDFVGSYKGKQFVVECKGMITESFPLRWKLFKRYLKSHRSKHKCYLVRNHKQVEEMIKDIKCE